MILEIICITSPKAGDGAGFCSINTAMALCNEDTSVLIADFSQNKILDTYLGVCDDFVFTLKDFLDGKCDLDDCIVKNVQGKNVDFVSAPFDNEIEITNVIEKLTKKYNYFIIYLKNDSLKLKFYKLCDKIIYVVAPDDISCKLTQREIFKIGMENKSYIIINKVIPILIEKNYHLNIDDICDKCGVKPIGIGPFDLKASAFTNNGINLLSEDTSLCSLSFKNIGERINGKLVPALDFSKTTPYCKILKNKFNGRNTQI